MQRGKASAHLEIKHVPVIHRWSALSVEVNRMMRVETMNDNCRIEHQEVKGVTKIIIMGLAIDNCEIFSLYNN